MFHFSSYIFKIVLKKYLSSYNGWKMLTLQIECMPRYSFHIIKVTTISWIWFFMSAYSIYQMTNRKILKYFENIIMILKKKNVKGWELNLQINL